MGKPHFLRRAAVLFCLILCITSASALTPDGYPLLEGMDVSVWQGEIDFSAAAQSGIQVVYIRAGYGEQEDTAFRTHYTQARAAGLHIGFYHYLTAETEDEAVRQARLFAERIRGLDYDCRPAMDYESFRGLPAAQVNAVALAFLRELKTLTGQTPLVYSDVYAANEIFDSAVARYPLWAADYGPEEPAVTAHWTSWAGFQYTDAGQVAGVVGAVDRDRFTYRILVDRCPDSDPQPPQETIYTVKAGDTLWAIAHRFGSTVAAIVAENHLTNPDLIYPGQVLRIP